MTIISPQSWSRVYSVGHKKIDNEHKIIFLLCDKLIYHAEDMNTIKEVLKEIIDYTKTHFKHEEKYMVEIAYPEFLTHQKEHKKLVRFLANFIENIGHYSRFEIKEALLDFIQSYFVGHILEHDKKFFHFRRPIHDLKKIFMWQDVYRVGHEKIDYEHQKLFEIAFKALDISIQDKHNSKFKATIVDLYDYMKYHFENEEEYMQSIRYKYLTYHRKLHLNIIQEMNNFIRLVPTLPKEKVDRKLIEYMDIWLVNHIVFEDKRLIKKD
ncbi:bacteriohemerythrin [Candidatus Marinarcus aquaticus]|uniref:Hemerythrin-like domain-containing protein n=1 Tax=Candidatus Marinarcus aquaticus TaxID=2044504 RepID=A0A4Q0XNF2_9BACT|nr:bacteriohemerythrin [Candidatus Marinarcus aquaticus]RXJ54541.1 hypothetical protein CRV04_10920 [Candidatus Marinarcus aquaticus]